MDEHKEKLSFISALIAYTMQEEKIHRTLAIRKKLRTSCNPTVKRFYFFRVSNLVGSSGRRKNQNRVWVMWTDASRNLVECDKSLLDRFQI
jgi:hypothetical protein